MQFEIITKLLENDYININQELSKNQVLFPNWVYKFARIFVLICGLFLLLFQSNTTEITLGIIFIFYALFFKIFINFIRKKQSKKIFQSSHSMQEEIVYSFSDDFIKKNSETSTAEIKWTSFNGIIESVDYYLLMSSKVSFLPIHKKLITSEQISWIKSKII